jgi:hypothetical protein
MGKLELEILCVFCASVVNRGALTQPQGRKGTVAIFSAGPHPHNSAKSHYNIVGSEDSAPIDRKIPHSSPAVSPELQDATWIIILSFQH